MGKGVLIVGDGGSDEVVDGLVGGLRGDDGVGGEEDGLLLNNNVLVSVHDEDSEGDGDGG